MLSFLHRIPRSIALAKERRTVTNDLIALVRERLLPLGFAEQQETGLYKGSMFVKGTAYYRIGFDGRDLELSSRFRRPEVSSEPPPRWGFQEPYAFKRAFDQRDSMLEQRPELLAAISKTVDAFLE